MDFNELFYKPKRLAKKSKYHKLKFFALLLSLTTTLGILGYVVSKYSKKNNDTFNSYSIEDINKDFKKGYLGFVSNLNLDKELYKIPTIVNDEMNLSNEDYSLDDMIRDIVLNSIVTNENGSFRDNVVTNVLNLREALKDIPNEVKYDYILEHFKMTPYEFDDIQAVTGAEAKPDKPKGEETRYIDAFLSLNSMYNRMRSYKKCGYVRSWLNKSGSITLHDHIIAPGQYTTYKGSNYYNFLGSTSGEHYQAVLDFLFVADVLTESTIYVNPFLDFVGSGYGGSFIFIKGGNEFSYKQPISDRIPLEELYYYDISKTLETSEDVSLNLKK